MFLIESGYERESNDKRGGDAWRMRRQAYGALLNGALAGHAYGHRELWRFSPQWREAANDPGYRQMRQVKELFAARAWWKLEPDQRNELAPQERGQPGEDGYVSAARAGDGSFAIAYLPTKRALTIGLTKLSCERIIASWFNPRSGEATRIAEFTDKKRHTFEPPGDDDWVLLLDDAARNFPSVRNQLFLRHENANKKQT